MAALTAVAATQSESMANLFAIELGTFAIFSAMLAILLLGRCAWAFLLQFKLSEKHTKFEKSSSCLSYAI